ncbi:MAG: PEGA domain-containing protein [Planctomycetota bacterium]
MRSVVLLMLLIVVGCGGVQRTLTVTSEPSGALVYLNGEEAGRTPMTRDFVHYGKFDVAVRKDGFETNKQDKWLVAPWWQWVPFDLAAELSPVRLVDRKTVHFKLEPSADTGGTSALLERADETRALMR